MKPYFRDIWCLGPGEGYPGAFPKGLITRVRRKWWGKKRLMMFSGSFKEEGWTTVDIKPELGPSIVANCENLPLSDESFDLIMLDPPYSEAEALSLYNLPYVNIIKALNEAERVCSEGGIIILLHRLIPSVHPQLTKGFKSLEIIGIVGVFTITGMSNIRALTIWRKPEKLKPCQ